MTPRQSILKTFYPLIMKAGKWFGVKSRIETNNYNVKPTESFYNLTSTSIDNTPVDFADLKGRKILLVNIASDCGYTNQLNELQKLYEIYKNSLQIIGFPANDFKEQEKGSDAEITSFCKSNFGVEFMLMKKSVVIKNARQNNVFRWLTDKNKNGWNDMEPEWNFTKYLVNEEGILTHYFGPAISPLSNKVRQQI